MLLFSTDYPHWHFERPTQALPDGSTPALAAILPENARRVLSSRLRRTDG